MDSMYVILFNSKRNSCFPKPDKIIPDNVCDDTLEKDDGDISDGFTDLLSFQSSFLAVQHTQGHGSDTVRKL